MVRSNRDDNTELFWEVWDYQSEDYDLIKIQEDLGFEALVQELCPDVSLTEFVNFDADIPASRPLIKEHKIDLRRQSREDCINAVLNENNTAQEISDDDYDDDEEIHEIED